VRDLHQIKNNKKFNRNYFMARIAKSAIKDEALAQFTYSIIYNLSVSDRQKLPETFRAKIRTERKAKKFAYTSSSDEKREFFSYINVGFYWTFVNLDRCTDKDYYSILLSLHKGAPLQAIKDMAEKGVCVTSDKDYTFLLEQMSVATVTGEYRRVEEMARVGNLYRKWSKRWKINPEEDEADKDAQDAAKFINAMQMAYPHLVATTGLKPHEYQILNYLYIYYDQYNSLTSVHKKFIGIMSEKKVAHVCTKLLRLKLVVKSGNLNEKEYMISKAGIRVSGQFRRKLMQYINF
jgi:hypothetical protein